MQGNLCADRFRVLFAYLMGLTAAFLSGMTVRDQHPLLVAAIADLVGTTTVFAFSVIWNNSSVYDPYWSVAPLPIAIYWAWNGGGGFTPGFTPGPREALVLFLLATWGVRLTANWVRRWKGMGDEDFRYRKIRERTGRFYWPASFLSIHLMPTIWVFLGMLPPYFALSRPERSFGWLTVAAAIVTLLAIFIEWLSDQQLASFLRLRHDPQAVLARGLWAWSRHPNYFGEVLFWWGMYLFGLDAAPDAWWMVAGPLSITVLFVFISVPWMDRRMLAGHPGYQRRLENVSGLVPWPPRNSAQI